MPVKSNAAILYEFNQPLRIETIEVADPGPGEVMIKFAAAGLCHSDLNFIEGNSQHVLPVVLGHEGMGTVVKTGPGVTQFKEGDVVIPYLVPDCGECGYCRRGRMNQCAQMGRAFMPDYKTWFSVAGKPVKSFLALATFSEYTVTPVDQVQKVNPAASPIEACTIGCGITTGLGSALIVADVEKGSSVAVVGAGGVGLSVIQGARIAGAKTIIAIDVEDDKEPAARKFGATHFINPKKQDVVAEVKKITEIGCDYAFDAVGGNVTLKTALSALHNGGWARCVSIGINNDMAKTPLTLPDLGGGRLYQASFMGGAKRKDVAQYVDWFVEGRLNLDGMVTHKLKLDQINDGFDAMRAHKTNRAVIVYD